MIVLSTRRSLCFLLLLLVRGLLVFFLFRFCLSRGILQLKDLLGIEKAFLQHPYGTLFCVFYF